MNNTSITTRQVFFITTPLLVIIGHFFLIKIYLGLAGRDAWLGMIIGFFVGFIIFLAMAKLVERFSGATIIQRSIQRFGPWLGRLLTIPLILYFFTLSVITLYGYSVFINSVFLQQHNLWIIMFYFAVAVFYFVHLGIEVISRVAEIILILNIISGASVSLALMDQKDYSKLLPILEYGIEPIIPVVLLIIAVFGEMIVLLMLNVRRESKKSISYKMVFIILFIVNLIIFPSTAAGPVAIFGVAQAQQFTYPVESMVRLINIGFIERFDVYGLAIMTVSAFLRLALLHYGTSVALSQWINIKDYRWVNWIFGGILFITSLKIFEDILEFYDFLENYYFYGVISSCVILVLWLAVMIIPKLSNNKINSNF